ncbi:MAG: PorT family protein [Bacteroidales bacterium]|nr:PorT family protein [Bacteroidales bacterium]
MRKRNKTQMKIVILSVLTVFSLSAFAQGAKWGIKAGGNLSSMSDMVERYPKEDDGYHITQKDGSGQFLGFHIGVFANLKMENMISFQPELLYSVQGGKHKRDIGIPGNIWQHLVFNLGYVQLPLLFEIRPISNFGILIGPQLGLNVSRKVKITFFDDYWDRHIASYPNSDKKKSVTILGSDFDDEIFNGGLKRFDAAMVFGLQYTIQRAIIGARYNLGLINGNNFQTGYGSATKGWKCNVIQVGLGYSF